MVCDFTSFSTVFQSYQDNGQMIMKRLCAMEPVYGLEHFASNGPVLNPLSYQSTCMTKRIETEILIF